MSDPLGDAVPRYLRRLAAAQTHSHLSDGQLLRRFAGQGDEVAFETLLGRHAAMVLGVCRRVLRHHQDAEDAFQATFLVLARKAASICKQDSVGCWLHGVARRLACKARAEAARRQAREARWAAPTPEGPRAALTWEEVGPALDEELQRLAEQYRAPLVLCYLEGKTRDEAARQLGWSLRTLMRRLGQGRELLRRRLSRRGVTLGAALLAAGLSSPAATAAVPELLLNSTGKAAAGGAAAPAVSAEVAALTEGVLRTMLLNKLKMATAALLLLALLGVGAGAAVRWQEGPAAGQPETATGARATAATPRAGAPKAPPAREAEQPETDQRRLQGTWQFVSATQGDKTIRKEDLGKDDARWKTITFTGDKVRSVNVNTGGKEVVFHYRVKLNPSRKPKAIDLTALDGPEKGETVAGLYELDGDLLRLCVWDQPPRPRALDAKQVSRAYILTFKRAAK
jgi:RNA polymerase sigma-70 factor (ECF subfamily)